MGGLTPSFLEIAIPVTAALIYAFIWVASRKLSRAGKIVVRLLPLGLILPVMIYVASMTGSRLEITSRPPTSVPPTERSVPRIDEEAARREEDRRRTAIIEERQRAVQEAQRRTEVEAHRRAELEAQRRAAEEAHAKSEQAERSRPATETPQPRSTAPEPTAPPPGVPAQPESEWDVVPVFYGTDRDRKEEAKRIVYTGDRGRRLELGRALVTVPKTHQVPNIERPFAIRVPFTNVTIYEQAEDPKQHFTIRELQSLPREQFLALVRERIGGSTAFKDQAVVFVHGYNTGFDYALFRTAQMAYDLKFDGASFLYSWPSGGGFTGYGYDRESSEQAEPYLREYIEMIVKETGAKSVSVIAHSMGNMPLLRVLQSLGPSLPAGVQLNQIILAAPDVDRNLFENLAANIRQYGRGVTLYCSSNDRAMAAARRVAGGIPRAGDVPADGPIVLAGIDTIDVSLTSTDYLALNHSSYAEKSVLLDDIGRLLQAGERPQIRIPILERIATPKGEFWRYPLVAR
jgi:esterase/lipase superfamily enzyme